MFSPISGILVDKLGLRTTTFLGGLLTFSGMFLSSYFINGPDEQFDPDNVKILCITYGLMFGTGAALAYTPTLAILGHYFKRYLGVVNGFVTAGSSVFTIIMPILLTYVETHYGLKRCLQLMTVMSAFVILVSFIYKPLQPPPPVKDRKPGRSQFYNTARSIINFDNWKKPKYIIWAISIPIALFGYFVPYVHIGKFITEKFPNNNTNLPLVCIGVTSGVGRIVFGMISDLPRVNRIFLQQISFYFIGLMTMCLPLTGNYYLLLIICLSLGLFDGCFISLLGPIAYDICGPNGAAQAIGFLLGLCSFGLTAGPPLAGNLYDSTQSYMLPFVLAGIPPIIGATCMFMIRFVKDEKLTESKELQPFQTRPQLAWDKGELANPLDWASTLRTICPVENGIKPMEDRRATLAGPGINSPLLKSHRISELVGSSQSHELRKYAYTSMWSICVEKFVETTQISCFLLLFILALFAQMNKFSYQLRTSSSGGLNWINWRDDHRYGAIWSDQNKNKSPKSQNPFKNCSKFSRVDKEFDVDNTIRHVTVILQ